MILPSVFSLALCLAVNPASDHVTAGDLAPAFPGMDTVDATTPLGFAPAPGVSRVFPVPELGRLAGRFHLEPPPVPICVERTVAPLDPEKLLGAMHASLPTAEISVLDWSRAPVPSGPLTLPAALLRSGPAGQWWSGYVSYGEGHRFSIWARVAVRIVAPRVIALRDLPPGQAIPSDAVAIKESATIPASQEFALSIDEVTGKLPRILIHAGYPILLNQLARPYDVQRGDTVKVQVQSGAARLEFETRAEGAGAIGDMVPLANPVSHRRFTARVIAKGRVSVDSSAEIP